MPKSTFKRCRLKATQVRGIGGEHTAEIAFPPLELVAMALFPPLTSDNKAVARAAGQVKSDGRLTDNRVCPINGLVGGLIDG